jgi:folate-binding protein YgfZ
MSFRTSLYEIEAGQGASFELHDSWEIAEHYGNPLEEYQAVRHGVGALNLAHLGKLIMSGRDRVKYLNNMVSNDIKILPEGKGCYATLLTHQGRMESDLFVYALPDELRLECSPAGRARLFESLTKYVISDVVTLEDRTDSNAILSLQGPRARETIEKIVGVSLEGMGPLDHRSLETPSGPCMVVCRDRTGCDGYDLWGSPDDAVRWWPEWTRVRKIPPVGYVALNWLRTEAGTPWYGVDMDDKTLPMEMGLQNAVSMTKGCYRGQEIVARVVHRGHLDRRLGGVALEMDRPPAAGTEVRSDGARAGEITSAIISPRLGKPLALAVLKTAFLNPGTPVEVAEGELTYPGEVVSLPL